MDWNQNNMKIALNKHYIHAKTNSQITTVISDLWPFPNLDVSLILPQFCYVSSSPQNSNQASYAVIFADILETIWQKNIWNYFYDAA